MISFALLTDPNLPDMVGSFLNDLTKVYMRKAGAQYIHESHSLDDLRTWGQHQSTKFLVIIRTGAFLLDRAFLDNLDRWYRDDDSKENLLDERQNVYVFRQPCDANPVAQTPKLMTNGDLMYFKIVDTRLLKEPSQQGVPSIGSYSFRPNITLNSTLRWFLVSTNSALNSNSQFNAYETSSIASKPSLVDTTLHALDYPGNLKVATYLHRAGEPMNPCRHRTKMGKIPIGVLHSTLDLLGTMLTLKNNNFSTSTKVYRWNQKVIPDLDNLLLDMNAETFRDVDQYMDNLGVPGNDFLRNFLWDNLMKEFGGAQEFHEFRKFYRTIWQHPETNRLRIDRSHFGSFFTEGPDVYLNIGDIMCSPTIVNTISHQSRKQLFANFMEVASQHDAFYIEGYSFDGTPFSVYR